MRQATLATQDKAAPEQRGVDLCRKFLPDKLVAEDPVTDRRDSYNRQGALESDACKEQRGIVRAAKPNSISAGGSAFWVSAKARVHLLRL